MITQAGFRIVLGLHVLMIGTALLLIHYNRHRSNLWGRLFQLGNTFHQGRIPNRLEASVYLILGWLSVVAALVVLLVGVRPTMVGV